MIRTKWLLAAALLAGLTSLGGCSDDGGTMPGVGPALTRTGGAAGALEPCDQCGVIIDIRQVGAGTQPGRAAAFEVVARLNSGQQITVTYNTDPGLAAGEQVKYVNGYFARR